MQLLRPRPAIRRLVAAAPLSATAAFFFTLAIPTSTQTAIANGDTRTLSLHHAHRKDSITVTFRRNGSYDSAALQQLNYFLRDWRNDQQTNMDPRLFDVIWESQRGAGSNATVTVLSAYRSPTTNAMLRSRSRAVAKESHHMYGKAMDMRMSDANMHRVREVALRLQRGGVGWYGSSNFVHLDVGTVRAWPRLSYDHLARLFPDGKSVHVSSDGRVLPGYEEARALVASRGGAYVPTLAQVKEKSFLARLFGWEEDDEADTRPVARGRGGRTVAVASAPQPAAASPDDNSSAAAFFNAEASRRTGSAPPPVQTAAAPAPASVPVTAFAPTPAPAAAPAQQVAARAEPNKAALEAIAARRAAEEERFAAPLPPRRPSQAQIAALIQRSAAEAPSNVPLPPQRPENLIVVAEASRAAAIQPVNAPALTGAPNVTAPIPPVRPMPARGASLPPVITQGSPAAQANAAALSAAGLLAYAPTIQPTGNETIRKAVARKPGAAARTAPVLAKTVGVRGKTADDVPLVAARLDRSNFSGLTDGRRLSEQSTGSLMGSTVTPLRAAAKHDPSRLLFAPADAPAQGFTPNGNPSRADNLGHPAQRQASTLSAQPSTAN